MDGFPVVLCHQRIVPAAQRDATKPWLINLRRTAEKRRNSHLGRQVMLSFLRRTEEITLKLKAQPGLVNEYTGACLWAQHSYSEPTLEDDRWWTCCWLLRRPTSKFVASCYGFFLMNLSARYAEPCLHDWSGKTGRNSSVYFIISSSKTCQKGNPFYGKADNSSLPGQRNVTLFQDIKIG